MEQKKKQLVKLSTYVIQHGDIAHSVNHKRENKQYKTLAAKCNYTSVEELYKKVQNIISLPAICCVHLCKNKASTVVHLQCLAGPKVEKNWYLASFCTACSQKTTSGFILKFGTKLIQCNSIQDSIDVTKSVGAGASDDDANTSGKETKQKYQ